MIHPLRLYKSRVKGHHMGDYIIELIEGLNIRDQMKE